MEAGNYTEAAPVFHNLAQKAEVRFPQRAPFLYFEAARASTLSGDVKKGVSHFRSGLTLLASQQRFQRVEKAGARIVGELRERGLNAEADEIETVIKNNLPGGLLSPTQAFKKQAALPTHCPSCGAAVKPNEVEWLDEHTAECDYCGSPIRAET
ncbi:hypothetical protein MASR2M66_27320 [Chloroflexota bacterium]